MDAAIATIGAVTICQTMDNKMYVCNVYSVLCMSMTAMSCLILFLLTRPRTEQCTRAIAGDSNSYLWCSLIQFEQRKQKEIKKNALNKSVKTFLKIFIKTNNREQYKMQINDIVDDEIWEANVRRSKDKGSPGIRLIVFSSVHWKLQRLIHIAPLNTSNSTLTRCNQHHVMVILLSTFIAFRESNGSDNEDDEFQNCIQGRLPKTLHSPRH